jgi:hypothetical protein
LRVSAHRDRWVQATRIEGEDTFVLEAASNEYLDQDDRMTGRGVELMRALGWTGVEGADFTCFASAGTRDQRRDAARMLVRTLVEVYGQDAAVAPRIEFP